MLYLLALLASITSPFIGGIFIVFAMDRFLSHERHQRLIRVTSILAEMVLLGTPGWILVGFGFLSFTTSIWVHVGGLLFFFLVLWIQNDIESFVMSAMVVICAVHLIIAIGNARGAYERQQRRGESTRFEFATLIATNQAVHASGRSRRDQVNEL
jgi:hypothetical protein